MKTLNTTGESKMKTLIAIAVISIMAAISVEVLASEEIIILCHNPKTGAVIEKKGMYAHCPYGWERVR
jgi:hypothetical protein